jgi:hypothetical protein
VGDDQSPSKRKAFGIKVKMRKAAPSPDIKPNEPIDITECETEVIDRELELLEIDKIRK